jgi:hypothetical protein
MIQRILSLVLNGADRAAPTTVYHESLGLVQDVEAHLVGNVASRTPLLGTLQRVVWLPTKFMANGFGHKLQALVTWAFISGAFILAKAWLMRPAMRPDPVLSEALDWVGIVCPVVLVMFPMPSVHAASGVAADDIQFSIASLVRRGLETKQKLSVVQQTLKVFEERCKRRVQSLMWLVGIAWAGWTYVVVKGMEATAAGQPPTSGGVLTSALAFYAVVLLYLAVSGYESMVDRLFRTIDIACCEISLLDESAAEESSAAV